MADANETLDTAETSAQAIGTTANEVTAETLNLLQETQEFILGLFIPWRFYQVAMIIGLFVIAHVVAKVVTPMVTNLLRQQQGWPMWRMRFAVLCNQRWRGFLFVILAWATVMIMRELTWPSRSYLISIVATLATGWLLISLFGRMIRNRSLRKLITWAAWIFVTLQILGLYEYVEHLLDAAAFQFGTLRISLLLVVKAAATIGILIAFANMISGTAERKIHKNEDISPSIKVLSTKLLKLFLYGAAFVLGLQSIGFDLTTLTVLSGAIGLGLGFGLQKIVSNLVSGVIILLDKSIKPGDVISLGETFGWITSLGARYTSVVTRSGTEYLIPNEDLITNQVVNWSHSSDLVRLDINFGVAYNSDPHLVKKIASQAPLSVDRVQQTPPPVCHVVNLGDSSIDFILRFWIKDPNKGLTNIRGNVFLALWDTLKEHGVEIPFPRRDITILPSEGGQPPLPKD